MRCDHLEYLSALQKRCRKELWFWHHQQLQVSAMQVRLQQLVQPWQDLSHVSENIIGVFKSYRLGNVPIDHSRCWRRRYYRFDGQWQYTSRPQTENVSACLQEMMTVVQYLWSFQSFLWSRKYASFSNWQYHPKSQFGRQRLCLLGIVHSEIVQWPRIRLRPCLYIFSLYCKLILLITSESFLLDPLSITGRPDNTESIEANASETFTVSTDSNTETT